MKNGKTNATGCAGLDTTADGVSTAASEDSINLPAWACYYPARAFMAWWLLKKERPSQEQARRFLAERFDVAHTTIGRTIKAGQEAELWKIGAKKHIRLASEGELWRKVAGRSVVRRQMKITLPATVISSPQQELRAWLAQGVLSRGAEVPTSRGFSGRELGRHPVTVTQYRRILRGAGALAQAAQYERIRPYRPGGGHGYQPQQFVKEGYIYRRLPDIVVLLDAEGQVRDVLSRLPQPRRKPQRRYFASRQALDDFKHRLRSDAVYYAEGTWNTARNGFFMKKGTTKNNGCTIIEKFTTTELNVVELPPSSAGNRSEGSALNPFTSPPGRAYTSPVAGPPLAPSSTPPPATAGVGQHSGA